MLLDDGIGGDGGGDGSGVLGGVFGFVGVEEAVEEFADFGAFDAFGGRALLLFHEGAHTVAEGGLAGGVFVVGGEVAIAYDDAGLDEDEELAAGFVVFDVADEVLDEGDVLEEGEALAFFFGVFPDEAAEEDGGAFFDHDGGVEGLLADVGEGVAVDGGAAALLVVLLDDLEGDLAVAIDERGDTEAEDDGLELDLGGDAELAVATGVDGVGGGGGDGDGDLDLLLLSSWPVELMIGEE